MFEIKLDDVAAAVKVIGYQETVNTVIRESNNDFLAKSVINAACHAWVPGLPTIKQAHEQAIEHVLKQLGY